MTGLIDYVPDVEVVLQMAPEELGQVLLQIASENMQNGLYHPESALTRVGGTGMMAAHDAAYPLNRMPEVRLAVAEAWQWLRVTMLVIEPPDQNGANGWIMLSRRGKKLIGNKQAFEAYRQAVAFPSTLLHPDIADRVWIELARGNLDGAVFNAFKIVEVAVRKAANLADTDIGVALMRKAFHPDEGPLSNKYDPLAEREALMHLFAGAIGSYKNPHSHRSVNLNDPAEAQEMVMLASHLLRIVDARTLAMQTAMPAP